jgi:hypothetical protein
MGGALGGVNVHTKAHAGGTVNEWADGEAQAALSEPPCPYAGARGRHCSACLDHPEAVVESFSARSARTRHWASERLQARTRTWLASFTRNTLRAVGGDMTAVGVPAASADGILLQMGWRLGRLFRRMKGTG